jgi:MSHA biogenesis protein MshJ
VTARTLATGLAGRFNRLSLRERLLIGAAVLAVIIATFNVSVLERLEARKIQLSAQLNQIAADMNASAAALAASGSNSSDSALARAHLITGQLTRATRRLDSASAGLVPPQRMVQVIHDVLSRQSGLVLVSLRTLPPYPLLGDKAASNGPYVHSVELVVRGRYLAVLDYLQTLQGLPWHFYWQAIDLDASHPPMSLVRVKLGTVSISREWIEL